MVDNSRLQARQDWLQQQLGNGFRVAPLAGDASFRRYYRVQHAGNHYVLMDAPPPHEDVRPFLRVREWLEQAGLRVSHLHGSDAAQGFLLLEDFGDITWAVHRATGAGCDGLFEDGLRQLHLLQASQPGFPLPPFDVARMQRECALYLDWYLPRQAGMEPDDQQRNDFLTALDNSLQLIAALPQVPVHLDYHSRNLMLPAGALPLGQIDYQDAVMGPVTYDLASLLYDCYQDYPESERRRWSQHFYQALPDHLGSFFVDFDDWHHKLRLTAMQRHIKAIGIFARLAHRDGKQQFLKEIPLTRKHLMDELAALSISRPDCPLLFAT